MSDSSMWQTADDKQYWEGFKAWPFAFERLHQQPDPDVIQRHALGHLSRALNIGRVTAFVGSGVSMAYGGITWRELLEAMKAWSLRDADKTGASAAPPIGLERLQTILKELPLGGSAGQQLGLFQLAENVASMLATPKDKSETNQFEDFFLSLVSDEKGREHLLRERMRDAGLSDEAAETTEFRGHPLFFYRTAVARILTARKQVTGNAKKLDPTTATSFPPDPLRLLYKTLGITRFVTTNYDTFIEDMLVECNVRKDWDPAHPEDQLRPVAESFVFSKEKTGKLTSLVSRDRTLSPWVIHLHGIAQKEGKREIIASEKHYRDRYVRADRTRSDVDDAMRFIHGASPILFVGVGMTEVDLLAPLRQLLSSSSRAGDCMAIAMIPVMRTEGDTNARQLELLTKYGVYSVVFGGKLLRSATEITDTIASVGSVKGAAYRSDRDRLIRSRAYKASLSELRRELRQVKSGGRTNEPLVIAIDDVLRASLLFKTSRQRNKAAELLGRGAQSVITTVLLCREIENIRSEWRKWATQFKKLPDAREPTARPTGDTGLVRRHALTTRPAAQHRFAGSTWSQALDSFVRAVAGDKNVKRAADGGRLFLLIAKRGTGKGHFTTTLQGGNAVKHSRKKPAEDGQSLAGLLRALGSAGNRSNSNPSVAIYNLGFSIEVSSVVDSISEFLWKLAEPDASRTNREVLKEWDDLRYNRVGRLRFVLERFKLGSEHRPRPLIVINAANLLFDGRGVPKNAQLRQVMDTFNRAIVKAKIDLILIVTPRTIPAMFRRVNSQAPDGMGDRTANSDISKQRAATGQKIALSVLVDEQRGGANATKNSLALEELGILVTEPSAGHRSALNERHFVHWMRPVRASVVIVSFFPQVAQGIAIGLRSDAAHTATSLDTAPSMTPDELRKRIGTRAADPKMSFSLSDPRAAAQIAALLASGGDIEKGLLLPASDDWVNDIDQFCRRLHRAVGTGRWPLTLVLSAVEASMKRTNSLTGYDSLVELCEVFERVPLEKRVDSVISSALDFMREGCDNPALHDAILWHLAVIGEPVECEVLAECPEIVKAAGGSNGSRVAEAVVHALGELVGCSLIYEMEPSRAYGEQGDARFCIHRRLQRHILRRFGAPYVEPPDVDRLSLTMYASQPNDMAAVEPRVHRLLSETVEALSGYPDNATASTRFATHTPTRRSQMLRAAFGILRNTYSVASMVRYRAQEDHDPTQTHDHLSTGLIERHRHQLRWLLHKSAELFVRTVHPRASDSRDRGNPSSQAKVHAPETPPFYAEEISWLYNESGVLSLVQGHMKDAIALFQLADRSAEEFERAPTDPVRTIIRLNTAIADIERGELTSARASLDELVRVAEHSPNERSSDITLICRGYVAVIHHLTGNASEADIEFGRIIPALIRRSLSRAASIFSRFHADLLRAQGATTRADEVISSAIRLAGEDHHEDVRQIALLARARIRVESSGVAESTEIHATLNSVEAYARQMGIVKLTCKALEIRARLHARNGDLRTASSLASSALEIAAQNELRIRKAALLVLMADLAQRRGMRENAIDLVQGATELADKTHYHSAARGAQRVRDRIQASGVGG